MTEDVFLRKLTPLYIGIIGIVLILTLCTTTIIFLILYDVEISYDKLCKLTNGTVQDCRHFELAKNEIATEPQNHPIFVVYLVMLILYQFLNLVIVVFLSLFVWNWKKYQKYALVVSGLAYGALLLQILFLIFYTTFLINYHYPFRLFVFLAYISEFLVGIIRLYLCLKFKNF